MKTFTIEQARSAVASGGVLSANLRPIGSMFALEFETRNGPAMLIASVSKNVRRFVNPVKAFEVVRDLGIEGGRYSVAQWHPEERAQDRPSRPDRARILKENHEAGEIKQVLEERILMANDPKTGWLSHDEVFATLESRYAD